MAIREEIEEAIDKIWNDHFHFVAGGHAGGPITFTAWLDGFEEHTKDIDLEEAFKDAAELWEAATLDSMIASIKRVLEHLEKERSSR